MKATIVGLLLLSAAAQAQVSDSAQLSIHRGQGWSLFSGETVGTGGNVMEAQAGFPGLSFGFVHGMSDRFDLGGIFDFNYGFEGDVQNVVPGLKLQALIRLGLVDTGHFNLGVHFAPGPLFYFPGNACLGRSCFGANYTLVGFTVPAGVDLGIPVASAIMINASFEIPFFVVFGGGGGAVVPLLFGGGAEYFISRQFSVSFNTRMGPSIWASNGAAYFTFEALFGAAYRL